MANTNTNNPFSNDFLKQIKDVLLKEKARLEIELGEFTKKNPHVAGDYDTKFSEYGDDSDENAHEVEEYTVNKPLEITLENTLRDINRSLTRLEQGTYGICKYCDKPIDEDRLLARPTSSSCVSCKKTLTDEV
jgi:RNA polymerase-binding transcription factor DksA